MKSEYEDRTSAVQRKRERDEQEQEHEQEQEQRKGSDTTKRKNGTKDEKKQSNERRRRKGGREGRWQNKKMDLLVGHGRNERGRDYLKADELERSLFNEFESGRAIDLSSKRTRCLAADRIMHTAVRRRSAQDEGGG